MSEPKTQATAQSVNDFLNKVEDEQKRTDGLELLEIFKKITKEEPVLWGTAIVGFGKYHYKSEKSKQEGDWMLTGFSPRKQNLTLYILHGLEDSQELLKKLGKHKTSSGIGGCLYINKLSDVDKDVLTELIEKNFEQMKRMHK